MPIAYDFIVEYIEDAEIIFVGDLDGVTRALYRLLIRMNGCHDRRWTFRPADKLGRRFLRVNFDSR